MLSFLSSLYVKYLWRNFDAGTRDTRRSQAEVLRRFLSVNRDTAFGREHGFAKLQTAAEYHQAVPVRKYDGFRPWVDQIAAGKPSILTAEPVEFFNQTSGTTGEPKLIPVTPSWSRETARLRLLWGGLSRQAHPGILSGKGLSVVYAAEQGRTSAGIPFGSLSGRVFQQSPALLRRRYALPYEVAEIRDSEAKQYVIMRLAMPQPVTFLFSTNPGVFVLLAEVGDKRKAELIRDIHDGTLIKSINLDPALRTLFEAGLKPDPAAAHRLEALAKATGTLRPSQYWPDCSVLGCWLGSTVGVAARRMPDWYGPQLAKRDLGLATSEGIFTLPIQDDLPAGVLTVQTNFYEFFPADSDREKPPLLAHELEVGGEYNLIVTTPGGLYRYDIDDIVRVVAMHNQAPVLEFLRKGKETSNLAGEKMHVSYLIKAIREVQEQLGIEIAQFRAHADASISAYRVHLEFPRAAAPVDLKKLRLALEQAIVRGNKYYAARFGEGQLKPIELCVMKAGWFDRYVEGELARGARHGQFKPNLLTSSPEPEDEILQRINA